MSFGYRISVRYFRRARVSITEEESRIRATLDFPNDTGTRLRFASWLEEHGSHDQADAIRLRASLAMMHGDEGRYGPFERREGLLSRKHRGKWVEHCGLPLTIEQAILQFRRRLTETATWCERKDGTIRTPILMPPFAELGSDSPESNTHTSERQNVVNELANTRARLLAYNGIRQLNTSDRLPSGRLLAFYPDAAPKGIAMRADGTAFLDENDMPTWDSWVFLGNDPNPQQLLFRSFLLCWVPSSYIRQVSRAIRLCSAKYIRWATDADTPLTNKLRKAHLLR